MLGILAGGGPFPGRVAAAAQAAGRPVFVVALQGFAEPAVIDAFPARDGADGRRRGRSSACRAAMAAATWCWSAR